MAEELATWGYQAYRFELQAVRSALREIGANQPILGRFAPHGEISQNHT